MRDRFAFKTFIRNKSRMPFAMHSTPNNRRILVGGTLYGAGNLGDEAILEGIQRCLPVGGRAGVCVAGHYDRYSQLGFEVFSDSTADVLRAILWCDEVWVGGAPCCRTPPSMPIRSDGVPSFSGWHGSWANRPSFSVLA